MEGKKTALPQVHPLPLFLLPPALSLSSASFCSLSLPPSLLFVLGTYQPEREKRRREGGGVSQHVRQGRGGKRERIACGGGTEKADREVGRRTGVKENSFLFFKNLVFLSNYFLLLIKSVLKLCWVLAIKERKPTRERR